MNPQNMSLDGRTAFVTGAGSGIGREVAITLAGAGARVTCADLDGDSAAQTAELINRGSGPTAWAIALDVTDRTQVEAAVARSARDMGSLDVLCNIAGVPGDLTSVADLDEDSFDRIFRTHFKGVLYGCQAALRLMIPAGRGSIINTGSSATDLGIANVTSYAVSKAAITMMTRNLATEVGSHGIRANVVAPGFVPTPLSMDRHDGTDEEAQDYQTAWAARSPLRRVGSATDVAQQFLYLASDASSFVTGQTLRANGGATMPW